MKLIALIIAIAFGLLVSSLFVGAIGAVFLESPWIYGYHRAWERWGWLTFFWLFVFVTGSTQKRR